VPTMESTRPRRTNRKAEPTDLCVALPEPGLALTQDSEWCVVETDLGWQRIRFHDYGELYSIPGLYEHLFYDILKCDSPAMVCGLLDDQMRKAQAPLADLRVLDLGAGNGMVGERLHVMGVETIVGVDICEEAAPAVERDRPGIYADYLVSDITCLPESEHRHMKSFRFTGMTCVAALGFGDIPPAAFVQAYNLVAPGGWIAFNIKADFLTDSDPSGFAGLIRAMLEQDMLTATVQKRYRHRISTDGKPLDYIAIVGRKTVDVPEEFLV
jgi:SAM-dependent methyltransferase